MQSATSACMQSAGPVTCLDLRISKEYRKGHQPAGKIHPNNSLRAQEKNQYG
jgi:hypothetical protein